MMRRLYNGDGYDAHLNSLAEVVIEVELVEDGEWFMQPTEARELARELLKLADDADRRRGRQ